MDENNKAFERLLNAFEDFKERLIRIEENVKGLPLLKEEQDRQKIDIAQTKESVKIAHKRIDSLEKSNEEKEKQVKWLKGQMIVGAISIIGGFVLFWITKTK